jgi:predicted Fe-S protein YdhL (DUF1289 family)
MSHNSETKVYSPCLGVCVLDEDELCIGCFRLLSEITWWDTFENEEKKMIILACKDRKEEYRKSYK